MIGEKLRKIREEKGLSIQQVTQIIGCSKNYLYRVEKGWQGVGLKYALKIEKIYGINLLDEIKFRSIGEKIKYARERLGLTEKQVAEKVGVSPDYIRALESNSKKPGVYIAEKLYKLLQMERELMEVQKQINTRMTKASMRKEKIGKELEKILNKTLKNGNITVACENDTYSIIAEVPHLGKARTSIPCRYLVLYGQETWKREARAVMYDLIREFARKQKRGA
ncbi:hypothetical protein BBF96_03410 [Anoxybacter fermentans]|uniref:HTH cro/C1-type domain-containing protein n=1 Tax=Anoxybacter fermentans TaxID=1323375 RepID=A0A3S9SW79_9FIRM|nr:helix-turn-helix domain-containing protein [Anoxybacter fermentans]AZR72512.1 hypothetical protein BBF96_03410 [Anoxybacter fermentans]